MKLFGGFVGVFFFCLKAGKMIQVYPAWQGPMKGDYKRKGAHRRVRYVREGLARPTDQRYV